MPSTTGKIEKLVLFTGFSCNERCPFCIDLNKRDIPDKSTSQIVSEMVQAKERGVQYLELIGGEATIRGDFFKILAAAKRLAFEEIVVVTNGRMFSIPEFAKRTVDYGVTDIVFSVHGHDAKLHDAMVASPGAFADLRQGIENLRALGFERIFGNCTVTRRNMEHLPEIGKFFLSRRIHHVEFIFVDPTYGGGFSNFDEIVPEVSEAAPWMRRVLDVGREGGTRDWTVRYVPLCHFEGYFDQISEIREVALFHTRHWAPDFVNEDVGASRQAAGRKKTEACSGCAVFDRCEGLWTEYLRRRGDKELRPVREAPPAEAFAGSWSKR